MIKITIDDSEVRGMLAAMPRQTMMAMEKAIDKTARAVRDTVKTELPNIFDRPVPYTKNSLQLTLTYKHNMEASVWFKDPVRMRDHYLAPQVYGGARKLKGFERALGGIPLIPGRGATLDQYGNVPYGQIRQILSVLKRAEYSAGYNANITARSARSNRKQRDYVFFPTRRGKLPPGIYQRVATGGAISGRFSTISDRKMHRVNGPYAWQTGSRSAAVRARGLKAIFIKGRGLNVKPLFPFYEMANKIVAAKLGNFFSDEFSRWRVKR